MSDSAWERGGNPFTLQSPTGELGKRGVHRLWQQHRRWLQAYHAAVAKGTDVDQPRNLAKSVTVE